MNRQLFIAIGTTLFILFVLQDIIPLKIAFIESLQEDQMYRRWSGLFLSLFILFQWSLSLVRVVPKWEDRSLSYYTIHTWLGAFTPLFFYVHSTKLGYQFLFLLSLTFLVNFLLGMFNLDVLKSKKQWYFQGWMITHVALSIFISLLTVYHIWIVFYYE